MADKLERFTQRARRVLMLAQENAEKMQHTYIGTEHLLLGFVLEESGVAGRVLRGMGVESSRVQELVERRSGTESREARSSLELTPRTKRVIELGVDEARRMGHHYIGTEHLLLGMLRQGESVALDILGQMGIDPEAVRRETLKVIKEVPTNGEKLELDGYRFFEPHPAQRRVARELYEAVADLPLVCPHGHVDPWLLADEDATFGTPAELLIIPDHYVFRMLCSQGIPLESLGVQRVDGGPVERDHRKIWQIFAENFHLFRGTPTGVWITHELRDVFGIDDKLTGASAQDIYDEIAAKLALPEFRPRRLFEQFNIEVLCTTDAATDTLPHHQAIRDSGWEGDVRPTFRPDAVVNLLTPGWRENIDALSDVSDIDVDAYPAFIRALEERRAYFKSMGATATDHAAVSAYTTELDRADADAIFQRALRGQATPEDAHRFTAHMIMESARMSIEDGLVMQFHVGSVRNHNRWVFDRFGADRGCDIPERSEFTHNLRPLLNKYGNDARLSLIVFTLDESAYARELAPLAGHYPAMKLGPPWWFHDSVNGIARYFDRVMETAGLYNTVGFNDDTRAFPSIPARHDVWRRVSANWLAGLVLRGIVDVDDAQEMMVDVAYRLAKKAYKFE